MTASTQTQSREGFFGFLDGVANIADSYWSNRYGGRVEQIPPGQAPIDPDVERSTSGATIAGLPQQTVLLGLGALLVVLLIARK